MSKTFYEFKILGPKLLCKGLAAGFLEGRGIEGLFYLASEQDVETHGLLERIEEKVHLVGEHAHLIVEESIREAVEEAIGGTADALGLKIERRRKVMGSSFLFRYEAFNREHGEALKALFEGLPAGLAMAEGYSPEEVIHEDSKGVEGYAPEHAYTIKAEGKVSGEVDALLGFRRKIVDEFALVKAEKVVFDLE